MQKRCKPLLICPEDLEAASQSDCDYYYTLCQICRHGARFDSIHLALSQLLLLKQASCNPRLSHL